MASRKFRVLKINLAIGFTRKNCIGKAVMMLYPSVKQSDKSNI